MNTNSQKIVHLNYTSTEDGTVYQGQFTVRRLTVRNKTQIAVRKTQLNGGMHYEESGAGIDEHTDTLNYMLAAIEIGIASAPPWFKLDEIYDMGLVSAVFKEVTAFQDTFRPNGGTSGATQPAPNGAQGSSTQVTPANGPGTVATVVGNEVQLTLDP